jgi:hypothetical protein
MAWTILQIGDEPEPAGIVLMPRIVETFDLALMPHATHLYSYT